MYSEQTKPTLKIGKNQCLELAQLIMHEFYDCVRDSRDAATPDSIKQAFMQLIMIRNQRQNQLASAYMRQLRMVQERVYVQRSQHIGHMNQKELDLLLKQHQTQKIITRLIGVKNEKYQQLNHMKQKYDLLLAQVTILRSEKSELTNELESMRKTDDDLRAIAELKKKVSQFQSNQKSYQQKLQSKTEQIKMLNKKKLQLQQDLTGSINSMKQQFEKQIIELVSHYKKIIQELTKQLKDRQNILSLKKEKQQKTIQQLKNTIKQLINDLSQAINYERKQKENDQQWLLSYRAYKKKKQLQRDNQQNRQKVYPKIVPSKNDQFIKNQMAQLQKFRKMIPSNQQQQQKQQS